MFVIVVYYLSNLLQVLLCTLLYLSLRHVALSMLLHPSTIKQMQLRENACMIYEYLCCRAIAYYYHALAEFYTYIFSNEKISSKIPQNKDIICLFMLHYPYVMFTCYVFIYLFAFCFVFSHPPLSWI